MHTNASETDWFESTFTPELLVFQREGKLPAKDHYLYKALTEKRGMYLSWKRVVVAEVMAITSVLVLLASFASAPFGFKYSGMGVILFFALLMFAWLIVMNNGNPIESITEIGEMLRLTPEQLCASSEGRLKERAREILYEFADAHSAVQRQHVSNDQEFLNTYYALSTAFARLKKYGLVPPDADWKPYFHHTATTAF